MAETKLQDAEKPQTQPSPAGKATEAKGVSSAAAKANHQDKTKDKPDSGRNEDG